jgi:hypothetical protein
MRLKVKVKLRMDVTPLLTTVPGQVLPFLSAWAESVSREEPRVVLFAVDDDA